MISPIDKKPAIVRDKAQRQRARRCEHWLAALWASGLGVLLLTAGWTPSAHAALSETAAILNPTPDHADGFGVAVDIDGDLAIVGAYQESTDAGNANPKAGAAYIYQRSNGAWTLVQKLVPNDRHANQRFGGSVSISGSHTALIGAGGGLTNGVANAGAAYFFVKGGNGVWQQAQKVTAPTPEVAANFGGNGGSRGGVALDAAGDTAVIGAWREPAGGPLRQSGAAYVYRRQGFTTWQMVQRVAPPFPEKDGHFGAAVALRNDHIMIGAPDEKLDPNTTQSIAISGTVYHFSNTGTSANPNWQMAQRIVASDRNEGDGFGKALAFSGNLLVVGSVGNSRDGNGIGPLLANAGAAYVFNATAGPGGWVQTQKLTIPAPHRTAGDQFGASVALDKNTQFLVVGAPGERHDVDEVSNPIPVTGSAYVYQLSGTQAPWTANLAQKLVASDRSYHQVFGYRVGVTTASGNGDPAVLIGSYQFILPASPPNPSIPSVGKVYLFE